MVRWVIGLNHQFAKLTYWQRYRGFESPSHRKVDAQKHRLFVFIQNRSSSARSAGLFCIAPSKACFCKEICRKALNAGGIEVLYILNYKKIDFPRPTLQVPHRRGEGEMRPKGAPLHQLISPQSTEQIAGFASNDGSVDSPAMTVV